MQIKDKKLILKKSLYYLFGFLPLIITLFIYPHIPKHVPSHYTAVGEIANWNSREQILIIPFLLAIFTYFKPKIFVENFKSKSEEKVSFYSTMLFILSIDLLSMLELFTSFTGEDFLDKFNFYNLLSCIICFIFIFLGYTLSNCTRNSTFSIKIPMHLMDNDVWKKMHSNLGAYFISSSIVFLPIGAICENHYIVFILMLEILFIIVVPIFVIYFYIRKHLKHKNF